MPLAEHRFCVGCGLPVEIDDDATPVPGIDYPVAPPAWPGETGSTGDVAPDPDPDPDLTMALAVGTPSRVAVPATQRDVDPSLRITCASCGAVNSAQRLHCARCDLALDGSGERSTRHDVQLPQGTRRSVFDSAERRSLSWVGIVTATALGFGAIVLAVLASTETGPFRPAFSGPAVFDASTYGGTPVELPVETISALTEHERIGEIDYGASLVLDDDLATAWNNDGDQVPDGVGEELRIEFGRPVWATGLLVANGYQRDDQVFTENARPTLLRVTLDGIDFEIELLDRTGQQQVSFGSPQLTTRMTVEILEVVPGNRYADVAISELRVLGHPAVGADVSLARLLREAR